MRLFIAIKFDGRAHKKLTELRDQHRRICNSAVFSSDENLHLTLAFLGEVPNERLENVRCAMDKVAFSPILLEMHGREELGEGLLCLSVYKSDALVSLKSSLDTALSEEGFSEEPRSFRPHVTLARNFYGDSMLDVHIHTSVAEIVLFSSEYVAKRRVYTELYKRKSK